MKNRLMDYSDLDFHFKAHLKKQHDIYEELRQQLIEEYLNQGYWYGFALVKANNDILALRSKPKNVHTMTILPELEDQQTRMSNCQERVMFPYKHHW